MTMAALAAPAGSGVVRRSTRPASTTRRGAVPMERCSSRPRPTLAALPTSSIAPTSSRAPLSTLSRRPIPSRGIRASATGNPSSSPSPLSASTSSEQLEPGTIIAQLPIFPLNMVAFPHADVPLHIFEARYRVLFSTLLEGDEGIDEGLVSAEKPWAGTRSFGLSWSDGKGGVAGVGTRLHITKHSLLEDGRMYINSVGVERFRIKSVVQSTPIVVAEVEILPELLEDAKGKAGDDEAVGLPEKRDEDEDVGRDSLGAEALASLVADAFRSLIALNLKMGVIRRSDLADKWNAPASAAVSADGDGEPPLEPPELTTLGPAALSHWVAAYFGESPMHQQVLLQEDSVPKRLRSLLDVLEGTVKFYRAKAAIQAVSSSDSDSPPAGGPD